MEEKEFHRTMLRQLIGLKRQLKVAVRMRKNNLGFLYALIPWATYAD